MDAPLSPKAVAEALGVKPRHTTDEAQTMDCCGAAGCGVWVNNRRLCRGPSCMGWREDSHWGAYCGVAGKP